MTGPTGRLQRQARRGHCPSREGATHQRAQGPPWSPVLGNGQRLTQPKAGKDSGALSTAADTGPLLPELLIAGGGGGGLHRAAGAGPGQPPGSLLQRGSTRGQLSNSNGSGELCKPERSQPPKVRRSAAHGDARCLLPTDGTEVPGPPSVPQRRPAWRAGAEAAEQVCTPTRTPRFSGTPRRAPPLSGMGWGKPPGGLRWSSRLTPRARPGAWHPAGLLHGGRWRARCLDHTEHRPCGRDGVGSAATRGDGPGPLKTSTLVPGNHLGKRLFPDRAQPVQQRHCLEKRAPGKAGLPSGRPQCGHLTPVMRVSE